MPNATPYSLSERKSIERGFYAVCRAIQSSGRLDTMFDDALRIERKERPSLQSAQANLCRAVLDGIRDRYAVVDLADLSRGSIAGVIIGAWIVRQSTIYPDRIGGSLEEITGKLEEADATFNAHIQRYLAKVAS
jgi:hypothetical protein